MERLSTESRKTAGLLLVVFPSVIYGGISLLTFLIDRSAGYVDNPIRQDLFRAGHAHAGVRLVLSLVVLCYVDEAQLPEGRRRFCCRQDSFLDSASHGYEPPDLVRIRRSVGAGGVARGPRSRLAARTLRVIQM